ncbi:MAG: enoyl-CoA hydratase-related protein [Pseudomonadota bacterium]
MQLDRQGHFAVIHFDRQHALNAFDSAALDRLEATLSDVERSDARVVLFTGAGSRAFSTGADISELGPRTGEEVREASKRGQAIGNCIESLPMPSIAVINGYALGGALELALCCTFRLAFPGVQLGFPEVKLGVCTGWGGTQRLPRLVPRQFALDLLMSGRLIDAAEACRMGLVHSLVDSMDEAIDFARPFSENSLVAMQWVREAVMGAADAPMRVGLNRETELSVRSYATDDAAEGIAAFLDKRAPHFRDR